MATPAIPDDPFALLEHPPFAVANRAWRDVFGVPAEVIALPARAARHGVPGPDRPPFQSSRADQIIAREAAWQTAGMALTPNRFPFAERQALLWSKERRREPTLEMLETAFGWEDAVGGSTMVNSIGAAGSVTRSHIHVLDQTPTFLGELPCSGFDPAAVNLTEAQLHGCELVRLDPPFPVIAVGLKGNATARARAMHELLEARTALAFNLIGTERTAWLVPRSPIEIPAPHFPQALGGAEIAGIWVCNSNATFSDLTTADMEQSIRLGGVRWA